MSREELASLLVTMGLMSSVRIEIVPIDQNEVL